MLQEIILLALTKPILLFAYSAMYESTFYADVHLDGAIAQPAVFSEVECIIRCHKEYLDTKDAFYTIDNKCFCIDTLLLENQIGPKYTGEIIAKVNFPKPFCKVSMSEASKSPMVCTIGKGKQSQDLLKKCPGRL